MHEAVGMALVMVGMMVWAATLSHCMVNSPNPNPPAYRDHA